MSALVLTDHAAARMAQRGLRLTDAELILLIGTDVEDGLLVRAKDYQEVELRLKQFLERLRRVVGKRLVIVNGRVLTAYHPSAANNRRILQERRR